MLDGGCDYVLTVILNGFTQTTDGQVICLRATRDKNQFVLACSDETRNLTSRTVDSSPRLLAKRVNTGRISKVSVRHLDMTAATRGSTGRGRTVVQINLSFGFQNLLPCLRTDLQNRASEWRFSTARELLGV